MPGLLVEIGPRSHGCFLHNGPVKILQTATEQPRQQTNACFLLISALWWKRKNLPKSGWKEWRVNSCYTFCLFISFLLGGWGVKKKNKKNSLGKKGACLCIGCWLQAIVCVSSFVKQFLWGTSWVVWWSPALLCQKSCFLESRWSNLESLTYLHALTTE